MGELALSQALERISAGAVPVPSEDEIFVGDGDYLSISAEFLSIFVRQGGLQPDARVLDVGCGIGRMAAGLACYLDPASGSYVGFDPVVEGIAWCRKHYGTAFPSFEFHWVDVANDLYRPHGRIKPAEFTFPVDDKSIDFAFATSVFTHMPAADIAAYMRQMDRVVRPDGRILATAYLFDGDTPARNPVMEHLDFTIPAPDCPSQWHVESYPPLAAVAFGQSFFIDLALQAFNRPVTVLPGRWRGGAGPWFQDLVLA